MLPRVDALAPQDEDRQHVLARCSGLALACAAAMMNAKHAALRREHPNFAAEYEKESPELNTFAAATR